MVSYLKASLCILGSILYTPSTSLYISHFSAFNAAAIATAVVSEPPLPSVVISFKLLIP